MRHHCIITGTGRAGTTLLVKILTRLGLDTGWTVDTMTVDDIARAGLEWDIRLPGAPYIVKSPWICLCAEEIVDNPEIVIDWAIIPIRNLAGAAESRRAVYRQRGGRGPGDIWTAQRPEDMESELTKHFYNLIYHLSRKSIPLTFLHYPRFATDVDYLYAGLSSALAMPPLDRVREACLAEVDRALLRYKPPA